MIDLFEVLQQVQGGGAANNLARQFGISQAQAEAAFEALLPAFTTGLRRNAETAEGLGSLLNAAASGRHADYFDKPDTAFAPSGIADGNDILGHMFGSKEVSRAVADQAAFATGLSSTILKQMLPAIASMVMGALFKQGAKPGAGGAFGQILEQMINGGIAGRGNNPLGDILGQIMGGGGRAPSGGADNPFGDIFGKMLGGAGASSSGSNPMGDILGDFFGGGSGRGKSSGGSNPMGDILGDILGGGKPAAAPEQKPSSEDIFGKMFENSRKVQKEYQKNIDDIFDTYLSGMKR
ncbi:MAG: DUF937 domain-containing protein [Hyphomicrobiales bacterium]|nr:DUF937 domain-containing protein [Hyphomicrobiales bacterium]